MIFDTGEDPVAGLTRFPEEQNLSASSFTAIGAFSEAMLGYFDCEKKDYERIPVLEQTEVLDWWATSPSGLQPGALGRAALSYCCHHERRALVPHRDPDASGDYAVVVRERRRLRASADYGRA